MNKVKREQLQKIEQRMRHFFGKKSILYSKLIEVNIETSNGTESRDLQSQEANNLQLSTMRNFLL